MGTTETSPKVKGGADPRFVGEVRFYGEERAREYGWTETAVEEWLTLRRLRRRRNFWPLSVLVPLVPAGLIALVSDHLDPGVSKFLGGVGLLFLVFYPIYLLVAAPILTVYAWGALHKSTEAFRHRRHFDPWSNRPPAAALALLREREAQRVQ